MNILVVGGAGYIGSHCVRALLRAGHAPVVLDDLSRGHEEAVRAAGGGVRLVRGDLGDAALVGRVLKENRIEAVFHFGAWTYVGESMERPADYYRNNTAATIELLRAVVGAGVDRFVFSSTAAVYGSPEYVPIDEDHPRQPINPYGRSKRMVEDVLTDLAASGELRSCALRYFNVAGSAEDGSLGEDHDPETHLIPAILQATLGRRPPLTIFGTDYDTPDGTCVRDYVHVEDLVDAHVLALDALTDSPAGTALAYNLGNGEGFSVREVLEAAEAATGRPVPYGEGPRRPGDPARLVASWDRARRELGWSPRFTDLVRIIRSAWGWFEQGGRYRSGQQ